MSAPAHHDNDPLTLVPDSRGGNDAHSTTVRPVLVPPSLLTPSQLRVLVSDTAPSHDSLQVDADQVPLSRPASSTSSLDPYYFGDQSPSDSPPQDSALLSVTPETRIHSDSSPLTPAWDPANIDRKGLVGVGELTTPHFDRRIRRPQENTVDDDDNPLDVLQEEDSAEVVVPNAEPDGADSPWTIEAVDGEFDDQDQVRFFLGCRGLVDVRSSSVTSNC